MIDRKLSIEETVVTEIGSTMFIMWAAIDYGLY